MIDYMEDKKALGGARFIAARLKRFLEHFFGKEEFHLGELVDLVYLMTDGNKFEKYRVESHLDGKQEPKAGGTVVNECRSGIILCDVIIKDYWFSQKMVTLASHLAKTLNRIGNNMSKEGKNVTDRRLIVGRPGRDIVGGSTVWIFIARRRNENVAWFGQATDQWGQRRQKSPVQWRDIQLFKTFGDVFYDIICEKTDCGADSPDGGHPQVEREVQKINKGRKAGTGLPHLSRFKIPWHFPDIFAIFPDNLFYFSKLKTRIIHKNNLKDLHLC